MVRIGIVVEGETEMDFIKFVLMPYLINKNILMIPKIIGGRGGNVSVARLVPDMKGFYKQHGIVTSLVDYYEFKSKGDMKVDELEKHIMVKLRSEIGNKINETKVIPYVQKYEFESLLFSDTSAFAAVPDVSNESIEALSAVKSEFKYPEEINDSTETAPNKRIKKAISKYKKRNHGPLVAEAIGIPKIREECPRFNEWLTKLEALGTQA